MLKIFLFSISVGVLTLGIVERSTAQNNAVGSALESFGKVAGSWYLNQKCQYLDPQELQQFEANVAAITIALGKDLGDQKLLNLIQRSAKETVYSGKYGDCQKTRPIFITGYAHSINWSEQIRQTQKKQG